MVIHMTKEQLYTRGGILDELMDTGFDAAGLVDAEGNLIRYSLPYQPSCISVADRHAGAEAR